jgi:hypothetical protein
MIPYKKINSNSFKFFKNKSQGEIFGLALIFVILIIGILIYAQFKKLNPDNSIDVEKEKKYQILAESTLSVILEMDSGCDVERKRSSVKYLINYCIENSFFSNEDPEIECRNGNTYLSCERSLKILNETLFEFFNSSYAISNVPFKLIIELPEDKNNIFNTNLTNFGQFEFKGKKVVEKKLTPEEISYYSAGYKRAPSGIITWATAKKNINFELYLYYR